MDGHAVAMRAELRARIHELRDQLHLQRERLTSLIEACNRTTARMAGADLAGPRLFTRDVVRLGDVEILVTKQAIRHNGGTHRLTPTEWQLFMFLLANPGVVHSRLDLASGAWGSGFAERNSEVEVYVSRLRRKLGPAGGLLETVRGRGYQLVLPPHLHVSELRATPQLAEQPLEPGPAVSQAS
jgi:DNA-binding response OmpR family regulator